MAKRILGIDLFRGFMIFYVILLHPLLQRVFAQNHGAFEDLMGTLPLFIIILGIPTFILALWGTVFTFLSGTAAAFQMTQKMEQSPHERTLTVQVNNRLVNSVLIMFFHYVFLLLFSNRSPDFNTTSLLTGYFESGSWNDFSTWTLLTGGTLESIAINSLLVSIIIKLAWQNHKYEPKRAIRILGIYAAFSFALATIAELVIPDPQSFSYALIEKNDLWSFLAGMAYLKLFAVRFAFFPVSGFAALGAIFGILLGLGPKVRFRTIAKLSVGMMIFGLIAGGVYLFAGFNLVEKFTSEHTPMMMQFVNVGLQSFTLCCLLWLWDYSNYKIVNAPLFKRIKTIFLRYSNLSLTIFIVEPFFSILWLRFFQIFYKGSISTNVPFIIGYISTVIFTWFIIVNLWSKLDYKGSFEWHISKLKDPVYTVLSDLKHLARTNYFVAKNYLKVKRANLEQLIRLYISLFALKPYSKFVKANQI